MIYITGDTHADFSRFEEEKFPIRSDMIKNNKIYKYGFDVLKDKIISEWLFEKRVNKFYSIFERENNNVSMKLNKISELVNIDERTVFLIIYSKIDRNNEDVNNVYDCLVSRLS